MKKKTLNQGLFYLEKLKSLLKDLNQTPIKIIIKFFQTKIVISSMNFWI